MCTGTVAWVVTFVGGLRLFHGGRAAAFFGFKPMDNVSPWIPARQKDFEVCSFWPFVALPICS